MLNELELQRVGEWNSTDSEYPRHLCIHELFELQVEQAPDAVALRHGNLSLTYRALNEQANQLAHHLVGLGVGPEKIVGVCLDRSPELIVSLLAVMKAGGAYLPLDATYPLERLELMLEECAAELIVTRGSLAERLPVSGRKQVLLDDASLAISSNPTTTPSSSVNSENLAYVIYTSGSTGQPKGVAESHRAVVNFLHWANTRFPMSREDVFLQIAPITFDASVFEIFTTLCSGAVLLLIKQGGQREPDYLVGMMKECAVTVASFVPPTLRMVIEEGGFSAMKSFRRAFCGGEVMPLDLMLRLQQRSSAELVNLYGPTEVSVYCTGWVCQRNWRGVSPPIGNPIFNTQVYLLNEQKRLLPPHGVGEIYLGGEGLSRGYINRPEITVERFVPNPFSSDPAARLYRTGDLGFWNADGTISFVGRADDQIKLRGFRIEPAEIESALLQSPKVAQALVICREDAPGNQQLVAYCIPAQRERLPAVADLRSLLGQSLPDYMIPSVFVEMEKFPLNANGKRDRKALPAPGELPDEPDGMRRHALPKDLLEQRLLELWKKNLGRKNIGIHDNFFDLGGHSLTAAMLAAEIEKLAYGRLPIAVFFQAPTVAELAAYLKKNREDPAWSSLVRLQPSGSKGPLFVMHGMGGDVFAYIDFARHLAPDRPVYGLQAVGLDGTRPAHDSLEEMADYYADQIRALHPTGPYYLLGYSLGGWIAYAVAEALIKKGGRIALLLLLDTEAEAKIALRARLRQDLALHLEQAFRQKRGLLPLCDYGLRLVRKHLQRLLFPQSPQSETPCSPIAAQEGSDQHKAPPDSFERACGRYTPPSLEVRMELFIPSERKPWQIDFWHDYARQGVRIHHLFEWHHDYIEAANAATLAASLQPLLTEADSK